MQPSPYTAAVSGKRRVVEAHTPPATPFTAIDEWAEAFDEGDRRAFLTILGRPLDRAEIYARLKIPGEEPHAWHTRGVLGQLQESVSRAWVDPDAKNFMPSWWPGMVPSWGLLWGLAAVPDFQIEEPLREMVDRSVSVFHTLFLALWEIRFLLEESGDFETVGRLIDSLGAWVRGQSLDAQKVKDLTQLGVNRRLSNEAEQLDVLCFVLALAAQNGLIGRLYVPLDGVERAERGRLKELATVLDVCCRWTKIPGMPLGLLVGWNGNGPGLGRNHGKLTTHLLQGVP